ncbi:MAG: helix-turn-helix domain-containing protein [Candidatus Omnitrophica bacterium]|nr:helix-turn-helix domain-containing protein [Candidatus Omnitrophota bacterium]
MFREVMDVEEVSEYLGLGKAKVYQLIEKKQIPASRIGKQYRFLKRIVDAWLSSSVIMKNSVDSDFQNLLWDIRKDFVDAGYTQTDIDQAVAKAKKAA